MGPADLICRPADADGVDGVTHHISLSHSRRLTKWRCLRLPS